MFTELSLHAEPSRRTTRVVLPAVVVVGVCSNIFIDPTDTDWIKKRWLYVMKAVAFICHLIDAPVMGGITPAGRCSAAGAQKSHSMLTTEDYLFKLWGQEDVNECFILSLNGAVLAHMGIVFSYFEARNFCLNAYLYKCVCTVVRVYSVVLMQKARA